jgi:hypothetical protein
MSNYRQGFSWGDRNLDTDIEDESSSLSTSGSKLAKSKGWGASIGGLLGAAILTAVTGGAAAPLLLAAASGAGALAGSAIGGAVSGVKQKDLLGGNYLKGTRQSVTEDIAKDEFGNVLKSAAKSFMGGMDPTSGLSKFGKGFGEGGGFGLDVTMADPSHISNLGMGERIMGGLKGGLGEVFKPQEILGKAKNLFGKGSLKDIGTSLMGGLQGSGKTTTPVASSSFQPSNLLDMAVDGFDMGDSMTEGMGNTLMELFPDMDEGEAAQEMGMFDEETNMPTNEFYSWLQNMGQ